MKLDELNKVISHEHNKTFYVLLVSPMELFACFKLTCVVIFMPACPQNSTPVGEYFYSIFQCEEAQGDRLPLSNLLKCGDLSLKHLYGRLLLKGECAILPRVRVGCSTPVRGS